MNKNESSQNQKVKFAVYKWSVSCNVNEQLEMH